MRNILALIGLLAIAFIGFGAFNGWFSFNGTDIEVHTDRARTDIQKGLNEGLKRISQDPSTPTSTESARP